MKGHRPLICLDELEKIHDGSNRTNINSYFTDY